MKYLKEIAIIFGITMTGELLNQWIPFPVPAGVYGLFILLGLLCSGAVKLQDVQATGNLLLDLMPLMFIPSAVGLIEKFDELKAIGPFFCHHRGFHAGRHDGDGKIGRVDHQTTEKGGELDARYILGCL